MRYRPHRLNRPARAGLTLVEMLIALALSIFIMSILSEAFVKGLEVFGQYKALADLEQHCAPVANIVRRDLRAQHFDGGKKLSECTASGKPMPILDGLRAAPYSLVERDILARQLRPYSFRSPNEGFFSVEEWPNGPLGATSFLEGQDSTNRPSYRDQPAFGAGGNLVSSSDVLHFSSRLEGNEPDKFFYGKTASFAGVGPLDGAGNFLSRYDAASNNGLFTSQAAELLYFLHTDDTANLPGVGLPTGPVLTFNLYRQAWLLIPSSFSSGGSVVGDATFANIADFRLRNDVSGVFMSPPVVATAGVFFNTMADVQHRSRRVDAGLVRSPRLQAPPGVGRDGSDILLTNVISFDVKVYDPFAYKIPLGAVGGGPASGRGAYVDIGDVIQAPGINPAPTAAGLVGDELLPAFGGQINAAPGTVNTFFETGTNRFEGPTGGTLFRPVDTPATHPFPFTSIQITIRVYEPKSRQTRQITIIQDM